MIAPVAFMAFAALGACTRAAAGSVANRPNALALGTLGVNVVGSFALGALHHATGPTSTVLGTGFLGAFTTFSSFARDTVALMEVRRFALSVAYLLATLTLSISAAAVGVAIAP